MEERLITCINCPVGCRITVNMENDEVRTVKGNSCIRGDRYARQEIEAPQRTVTAVIYVRDRILPCSVKTASPIPKEKIRDCMKLMAEIELEAPIYRGDTVVKNICDTGVDLIATRTVE